MCTDAYWPRVNGVTVSVESFSRALIKAGHRVLVICSLYPENQALERISNPIQDPSSSSFDPIVIRVPSYPLPISKEDRVAKFHKWFWVSKQLDAFKPDILHIHSEFVIGEFGFYYGKLNNLPIMYTFHTLWEDYIVNYIPHVPEFILRFFARRIVKNMAKRANAVIAPTQQIKDVLKTYKVKKPVYLLPTGIDAQFFSNETSDIVAFRNFMDTKYPLLKGKRILLFAGRVSKEKNISFLFRSLGPLLKEIPDVVLLIVGNGPDFDFFESEVKQAGLVERCVFTGYMERKDLSLTYAISHIFVFPSLTETQGLVTIEAMLSGIPVVAIGEMGTITVMGGDNGGFMVNNDVVEFQARVKELLNDAALYSKKCKEAKNHAQSWTIDTMEAKLEDIYIETINNHEQK